MRLKMGSLFSIKLKVLLIAGLMLFFAFERVLIEWLPFVGYFDEVFAIVTIAEIFLLIMLKKNAFSKVELNIFFLIFILLGLGIVGNFRSGILTNFFSICIDMISMIKVFSAYYWIRLQKLEKEDWDEVIVVLARITRAVIIILSIFYFASYLVDLGMLGELRYGLRSYRFLFDNPGNFSKLFYFILPVLSADLYYNNSISKKVYIVLALIMWISTLRARAIAFALCYILFAIWFFRFRKRNHKVKIVQIIPLLFIGVIIGWEQLVFYFTSATQARGLLLRYGFVTMQRYFPIGAGFGTYGSDVAINNYSALYTEYGFKSIYGMGFMHTGYLNDNYWPMIMGQFGAIGVFIVVLILYKLYKIVLQATKSNDCFYFANLLLIGFLVTSSVASKSYSEFSMIPIFMLHGVLLQREMAAKKYHKCWNYNGGRNTKNYINEI